MSRVKTVSLSPKTHFGQVLAVHETVVILSATYAAYLCAVLLANDTFILNFMVCLASSQLTTAVHNSRHRSIPRPFLDKVAYCGHTVNREAHLTVRVPNGQIYTKTTVSVVYVS